MSDPWRHHYLPEFYLKRWAVDGVVWRFIRPRGSDFPVHGKRVAPRGVGYKEKLYTFPRPKDPSHAAAIETQFLKFIDDRAAIAIRTIEAGDVGKFENKVALAQFLISLMYRTPGRIEFINAELRKRTAPIELRAGQIPDDLVQHHSLNLFTDLVSSESMVGILTNLRAFVIQIGAGGYDLMTSDRPVILSDGLLKQDAFVMLPIGPKKLIILAKDKAVPDAFVLHDARTLSRAVNDAVAIQSEGLVIGNRESEIGFIESRLLTNADALAGHISDGDGLIRWRSPLRPFRVVGKSVAQT